MSSIQTSPLRLSGWYLVLTRRDDLLVQWKLEEGKLETTSAWEKKSQQPYYPHGGSSGSFWVKEPRHFKDVQGCIEISSCVMSWKTANVLINIFAYNII